MAAVGLAYIARLGTAAEAVTLLTVVPPAYLAWVQFRSDRSAANSLDAAGIADQLATAIEAQWEAEAHLRRLYQPAPLAVSWEAATADLVDEWPSLVASALSWPGAPARADPGWADGPAGLSGSENELGDVLTRRVPTGRLVVLGEPGAGKTMLLLRLVLDLMARRRPGGAVPVLVSLSSWDPARQSLHGWLTATLTTDHSWLREPFSQATGDLTRVQALLDRRLLLPILDGLDEMPGAPRALALTKINEVLRPGERIVVSSRLDEFREAVHSPLGSGRTLSGAAGIVLGALDPADIGRYLRQGEGRRTTARWDPVLAVLGTTAPIAHVLRTPLMTSFARTVYNPRPGEQTTSLPDPAELCDRGRLPTARHVERQLFDAFLPAAYREHPDPGRRSAWRTAAWRTAPRRPRSTR